MTGIYFIFAALLLAGMGMLMGFLLLFSKSRTKTDTAGPDFLENQNSLKEIGSDDSDEWLLPGFDLFSHSGKIPINIRELDLRKDNFFGFNVNDSENKDYTGYISNPSLLSARFLELLLQLKDIKEAVISFKDEDGFYKRSLKRSGKITISGDAARVQIPHDVLDALEHRGCVIDRHSKQTYFPVYADAKQIAVLILTSDTDLPASSSFGKITEEISTFSKLLYQSFIFDKASRDPGSGFYNGMKFQSDLELIYKTQSSSDSLQVLLLLESKKEHFPALVSILGSTDCGSLRIYRISSTAAALLGTAKNTHDVRNLIKNISSACERNAVFSHHFGLAALDSSILSPQDWLKKAGEELLDNSDCPETNAQALTAQN